MPFLPQIPLQTSNRKRGGARVKFAETTPAVLRLSDGAQIPGTLQTISITGGLLSLSQPLKPESVVRVMFLVPKGSVFGTVKMLSPVAWGLQPFRFTTLHQDDHSRLQSAIQFCLEQSARENRRKHRAVDQIEKHRSW